MNAIVSGRSGRALIIEGETLKSVEIDDPATLVPRKRSDLAYLFGDSHDLHVVENTTTESVVSLLTAECNFTLALDLTLISLDGELESDIRREALEGLDELFEDSDTLERVEHVMYSHPVPDDGDIEGALEICTSELEFVYEFLRRLETLQPAIRKVDQAWAAIPTKSFDGHENRKVFRRTAVQEGLFHTLAIIESPASLSTFLFTAGLNQSIRCLPNQREILETWGHGALKRKSVIFEATSRPDPTVLIAEDSVDTRSMLKRAFELKGYRVIEAADGQEALLAIHHHRPSLIVMDLNMPVLDGLQTIREIRRREGTGEHVPIVAITAFGYSMEEAALEKGYNTYLSKPLDMEELDRALKALGFIL